MTSPSSVEERQGPRNGPGPPTRLYADMVLSRQSDARVDVPVQDIDREVEEHDHEPGHEHNALHHRRSEEHTSELQSLAYLVCRLLLEKKTLRQEEIDGIDH